MERNEHRIKYKDIDDKEWHYSIIKIFPFESARKRMGIVVKNEDDPENLEFYVKGADDVMKERVDGEEVRIIINEKTFELASEGLRTLCFAKKTISK